MLYTIRLKDVNDNNIEFVGSKKAIINEFNMLQKMDLNEIKSFFGLDQNDTNIQKIILLDELGEPIKTFDISNS